ncbi:hypothetical protein BGX29_009787 [Mortierella sp. GBA35]|nr:hypothetical protein BGX29_009787 [Mortierella sp. GBA35]KAG0200660.1 hypothetical protein BGX33_010850 [Mortierella sp. NVP41]
MAYFQDPWAKHHAWRNHALFTRRARIGTMFPGLGIATVAFAAYLGYEYVTAPKETHHHSEGSKQARKKQEDVFFNRKRHIRSIVVNINEAG